MELLEYENEIFTDCFQEDGLLVMAKGLGIERIFAAFLKLYCEPANLVLVLNTTTAEEEYFCELLELSGTNPMPKVINADVSVSDRQRIYLEGGVLFITARILVVDMLIERIPIHLVSGILVYKAHRVVESCQEAFILRLYRQKNKTGFVKAFSDIPQSFTRGFCQVERVMKSLFVRRLFLWPRFQASVVSLLERHKIDVVELHIPLTELMAACQTALLDLIDACIKELKRSNAILNVEDISVEYAITKSFDKVIRLQLDPIWHQLSSKTKQIVADLKTLRTILENLTQYDCVNFYNLVNSLKSSEKVFGSNAGWLFTDSAERLFIHAKDRLYERTENVKKIRKTDSSSSLSDSYQELKLEECPKWLALREVLDEIEEDIATSSIDLGSVRVLVAAQDDRTCSQLSQYLCDGGPMLLQRLYEKNLNLKKGSEIQVSNYPRGKNLEKEKKKQTSKEDLTLTQMVGTSSKEVDDDKKVGQSTSLYQVQDSKVMTFVHSLHGCDDPHSLIRTLNELQPRYVVLYDADMAFVRQLEVYKASHPDRAIRVYFLMYAGSTEEQRYLTTLRKEKDAFEFLIKEKAGHEYDMQSDMFLNVDVSKTMVIPEEREGKLENDSDLARDATPANATVNTRQGGMQRGGSVQQKVIVDMREFRSELPSLLHRRGIDIDPVTLEVGDYILTPDMCVERKSVSDLIGSLNNGRLYNQCVAMCRTYKRPVLLIEFDPNKPFSLQDKFPISAEISTNDTISRLTLLTLHFPKLRILWCQSPYATAELIEELKIGRDQPKTEDAVAVSVDSEEHANIGKYNAGPQDMLMKMPGVNSRNVFKIMNHVKSIAEMMTLTVDQLTEVMDSSANAKLLYDFCHCKQSELTSTSTAGSTAGSKQKGKRFPLKKPYKKS